MKGLVYSATLLIAIASLFMIWDRTRSDVHLRSTVATGSLGVALFAIEGLAETRLDWRCYLALPGIYAFSWLMWLWVRQGISPTEWSGRHMVWALLAVGLLSAANSGWR